jgi:hypothetical protein
MAAINSNFPSILLIPSSIQGSAKQQQIQALTNQVKANEGKIAKIDKEIVAREKIIVACEESKEAAKTVITEALKMIDYGQKGIKACEESKEIIKEMIGIYETLIARNEASKAYSKAADCSVPGKAYTTPYDEAYEESFKRAMDTSRTTENLGLKKLENIDFFDRISYNPVEKHYLFSMFSEWFSGFRSSTSSFFRWF